MTHDTIPVPLKGLHHGYGTWSAEGAWPCGHLMCCLCSAIVAEREGTRCNRTDGNGNRCRYNTRTHATLPDLDHHYILEEEPARALMLLAGDEDVALGDGAQLVTA